MLVGGDGLLAAALWECGGRVADTSCLQGMRGVQGVVCGVLRDFVPERFGRCAGGQSDGTQSQGQKLRPWNP